jgi:hypothetical protein
MTSLNVPTWSCMMQNNSLMSRLKAASQLSEGVKQAMAAAAAALVQLGTEQAAAAGRLLNRRGCATAVATAAAAD